MEPKWWHITRAANWKSSEQKPITLEEWMTLVRGDSSWRSMEGFAGRNPATGQPISMKRGLATWLGLPAWKPAGGVPFSWDRGEIRCPALANEPLLVERALELARQLGARVQDDDGAEFAPR